MACLVLRIAVLLWAVIEFVGAEICNTYGSSYRYCDSNYYCCDNGKSCCSSVFVGVGAIIGIVIGCIFFLSICVGIICCIAQSQKRPGRVIQPATGGQLIAVVGLHTTQQQSAYQQPQYYQPAQGYPAGQLQPGQAYPPPPPAYNSNLYSQAMQPGPAYPPAMGSNTQHGDNVMPAKQ